MQEGYQTWEDYTITYEELFDKLYGSNKDFTLIVDVLNYAEISINYENRKLGEIGYVDHQSVGEILSLLRSSARRVEDLYGMVLDFIFGDSYVIITNDNE